MVNTEEFKQTQELWGDKIYNWDISSAKRIREKSNFSKKELVFWIEDKIKMAYNYFIQHRDPDVVKWIEEETAFDFKK